MATNQNKFSQYGQPYLAACCACLSTTPSSERVRFAGSRAKSISAAFCWIMAMLYKIARSDGWMCIA